MDRTYYVLSMIAFVSGCANSALDELEAPTKTGAAGQSSGDGGAGAPPAEAHDWPGWCDVAPVFEAKCARCHGAAPDHGAPFALVSYEDTQVVSASGKPRYELIARAVAEDFMPATFFALEPPVAPLSADEKSALLTWCAAGAPLGTGCETR